MGTSRKKSIREKCRVEARLRDEVLLLDPIHRICFSSAVFDKDTNTLYGTKYALHYQNGSVHIR